MTSKRVVSFFDVFDEIPEKAKYLFSRKVEVTTPETEEQKNKRIISNNPEEHVLAPTVLYMHYYEVDGDDFEDLMNSGFGKIETAEKIDIFLDRYKLRKKKDEN